MTPEEARAGFATLAAADEGGLDLARAALYLAAEEYPALDVDAYVARLDTLARDAAEQPLETAPPLGRLLALNHYLFAEQGFIGNAYNYYDPRNSFLNEVLDRHTGIPITLSLVYLEVGWRLELPLAGVGMPGHFLVGYYPDGGAHYVDVFHQGPLLTRDDCVARLRQQFGNGFVFREEYLAPVSKRQILTRMLGNLKQLYQQREDWDRALAAVERILLLTPDAPGEVRDRGLVQYRRGALRAAHADLGRYLALAPTAHDADTVRRQMELVWNLWASRN
ncbi:MAG TPA: tetratricopeptide repeat protein [Chloroflexota bacterium]|jgi:regulator of sirC expression with transglutaminase-like and TPR domain